MSTFRLLYDRDRPQGSGPLTPSELIELYRHPAGDDGRGWLRTNFVTTLDGSISGPDGRSGSINTVSDHELFAAHRAVADVIMVGAETVRTEGYRAVDLTDGQQEVRRHLGLARFPTLAVVTGSLDLDPAIASPAVPHGPVMIITGPQSDQRLAPFRTARIEIVVLAGGERVSLPQAVSSLVGAGLPRILCEGGPRLHRDLLAAGLVDELSLTLAPTVVGGRGRRSTDGPPLPDPLPFELSRLVVADDDTVFTSYRRTSR